MTLHNTLNVKLSNLLLTKLEYAIKTGTRVTSNIICESNYENNFPR